MLFQTQEMFLAIFNNLKGFIAKNGFWIFKMKKYNAVMALKSKFGPCLKIYCGNFNLNNKHCISILKLVWPKNLFS